jgi:hypothetical protein
MPVSLLNDSLIVELPGMAHGPMPPPAQAATSEKNADHFDIVKVPSPSSQEKSAFPAPGD